MYLILGFIAVVAILFGIWFLFMDELRKQSYALRKDIYEWRRRVAGG